MENRGVIMFNRGSKCIVRAIVCLYSLRKYYDGPITFFLEEPYPAEFDKVCEYFKCDIVHNNPNAKVQALVRKTEMFWESPYDRTLWIDADTVIIGKIDEMFDYLDEYDIAIPHFAGWWSDGKAISKRIKRYIGICKDESLIDESLKHHPAINTGILSFRKHVQFMKDWIELARLGDGKMFIPDEVAFQVLYPSYPRIFIAPQKFNVSVLHDKGTTDRRIIHYHGQKHVLSHPNCDIWKNLFAEMREKNIANINAFLRYADKRLKKYIQHGGGSCGEDVTIVTACDPYYVDILRLTFENWVKYKKIDGHPVIVFVNGIKLDDSRLDFLRKPYVQMIEWSMPNVSDHREEMLSAFVLGTAKYVETDYWLKLDADSYATNYVPFINDEMKKYAFCGHKWGYSRPNHIRQLDAWAKKHWKRKLRNASPMIGEGQIEGRRFYHKDKRTISFIQLHKTKFTKFCVKCLREDRLPVPSQDTYMFYICKRFDESAIGIMNFKKKFGFTQGRGKLGAEHIKQKLAEVDAMNEQSIPEIKPSKSMVEFTNAEDVNTVDYDPHEEGE